MVTVDEVLDCLLGPSMADNVLAYFQMWCRKIDSMLTSLQGASIRAQQAEAPFDGNDRITTACRR